MHIRPKARIVVIGLTLGACALFSASLSYMKFQKQHYVVPAHGMVRAANNGTTYEQDLENLGNYWVHIHAATQSYRERNFDNAKLEINQAIEKSRSRGDVWVARSLLKDIYVSTGEVELALKEIDWMTTHNSRPDVLADLAQERSSLLTAKAAQNQTTT